MAVEKNGVAYPQPVADVPDACPGDILKLEIYLEHWSHGDRYFPDQINRLRAVQAALDFFSFFNRHPRNFDEAILPRAFRETTDLNGACSQLGGSPGIPNSENAFIDCTRSDLPMAAGGGYLFCLVRSNGFFEPLGPFRGCGYTYSITCLDCMQFTNYCPNDGPKYGGTVIMEVQPQASGVFSLCVDDLDVNPSIAGPDRSFMIPPGAQASSNARILPLSFECLTVTVTKCNECKTDEECDDGLFCNGAETCDENGDCLVGENPCGDGMLCDEDSDSCGLVQIPTITHWGLAVLLLGLLIAGKLYDGARQGKPSRG
jgi:hypothetical protein